MLNEKELKQKILKLGQFPFGRRRRNYQSYFMTGGYIKGSRDTLLRMDKMGIPRNLDNKMVLDLGSQIGAICTEAYIRGAGDVVGIDMREDYIFCAEELAKYNRHHITYYCMDLDNIDKVSDYINDHFDEPIDIVFLLSMYKHLKGKGFILLEKIKWRTAYIESNNCPKGYENRQAREIEGEMLRGHVLGWRFKRLGTIEDRGLRCLWKITNE